MDNDAAVRPPERIWLQPDHEHVWTWCVDQINVDDPEYVRVRPTAERAEVVEAIAEIISGEPHAGNSAQRIYREHIAPLEREGNEARRDASVWEEAADTLQEERDELERQVAVLRAEVNQWRELHGLAALEPSTAQLPPDAVPAFDKDGEPIQYPLPAGTQRPGAKDGT